MSAPPPSAPTVAGDRWPDLAVPALGSRTPTRRVSVVVVARRDEPPQRLLSALSSQTYPADLLDVVVVAAGGGSAALPQNGAEGVTVVPAAPGESPEAVGGRTAEGEIVCFLAPAAPVGETTVEAHARWHHAAAGLVTLGWLEEGGWLERYRERTAELSAPAPDHFRAVDLRGLAVSRDLLEAVGGVRDAGDACLTSLDLGWRLWCAGALFVPEPFPAPPPGTGDGRPPRSPRLVPPDRRLLAPVPDGAVPAVVAHVPAGRAPAEALAATVAALLASDAPGVAVRVEGPGEGLAAFDDPRVTVGEPPPSWASAPVQVWVPPGVVCAPASLRLLAEELATGQVGALSVTVPGRPPAEASVLAAATRALSRAQRLVAPAGDSGRPGAPVVDAVDRLLGHRWTGGQRVGFAHWQPERPVILGDLPAGAGIDGDVARQLAKRLDESDRELAAARARARRLDGNRSELKERLVRARGQVRDRDRRIAAARSEQDELRMRVSTAERRAADAERRAADAERRAADAERRADEAERRATALSRRRVVRVADALGRLARARRPGRAAAALRDLARALRR